MGSAIARSNTHAPAYAGEISPRDAWQRLSSEKAAVLLDVRTPAEWTFCGEPDLRSLGKDLLRISWKTFPTYALNEQFVAQVNAANISKDAPILIICRTGGRSLDAAIALTAQGYTQCFNVTDGFEGPHDESHQRGKSAGWKASGLPWGQA